MYWYEKKKKILPRRSDTLNPFEEFMSFKWPMGLEPKKKCNKIKRNCELKNNWTRR